MNNPTLETHPIGVYRALRDIAPVRPHKRSDDWNRNVVKAGTRLYVSVIGDGPRVWRGRRAVCVPLAEAGYLLSHCERAEVRTAEDVDCEHRALAWDDNAEGDVLQTLLDNGTITLAQLRGAYAQVRARDEVDRAENLYARAHHCGHDACKREMLNTGNARCMEAKS